MTEEVIEYRGYNINVSQIRNQLQSFKNEDGTPYYTPIELDREVQQYVLKEKRLIGRMTGARYEKNEGYRLAFYMKERQLYPKAYEIKVNDNIAEILVKKLFRHFYKIKAEDCKKIRFYGNRGSGSYGWWNIRLSHNPSIGLICHEVAHRKFKRHTKKMMKFIGKLINYCIKKGYLDQR